MAAHPASLTPPRGRPPKGHKHFLQVHCAMPPDLVEALDRMVDQEIQRTGRNLARSDIIRAACINYLNALTTPARHAKERLCP